MPRLSLVVCVFNQRTLLERLLGECGDCFDDLVVVHDGPDNAGVREIVDRFHGRFYEQPHLGSLEAQSPFAWAQAAHDWVLRLDADEFPSTEMKQWLQEFRAAPDPGEGVAGYTCIWPLWNGKRRVSQQWPTGRIFLFHRQWVRFFGLVEQTPIPEGRYEPLPLVLHHQPNRKSYGVRNLLFRRQAYIWRASIAKALLGKPTDLPCWRWNDADWPPVWKELAERPLSTAFKRLVRGPFVFLPIFLRHRLFRLLYQLPLGGCHHFLIGLEVARLKFMRRFRG